MKILTDSQKAILLYLQRAQEPLTVREISDGYNAPPTSVRTALKALERYGAVEQRGVAFTGATTWAAKP